MGIKIKQNKQFLAEFFDHAATWVLWPTRADVWRNNAVPIQSTIVNIIRIISKFEKVYLGVDTESLTKVTKIFAGQENIEIIPLRYNDIWIRDTSPEYIKVNGELQCVKWDFNAWGEECYKDWSDDNSLGYAIACSQKIPVKKYEIILEGGAVTTDGDGTLITTKESVLDARRNPELTIEKAEEILKKALGVSQIIWLELGLRFDETLGHVDNICQFIKNGEVIINWTEDKEDPQYQVSLSAYNILSNAVDAKGKKLKIHKLHQPDPIFITAKEANGIKKVSGTLERKYKQRLPASYVNLYIGNKFVIVPTFNDKFDNIAIKQLEEIMQGYKVIGIYSKEILIGGGNIHCILHQQPS